MQRWAARFPVVRFLCVCVESLRVARQFQAEFGFEPAHLLGDGALRDAELLGRQPEIAVTRGDREGAQAVQRRQAGRASVHTVDFLRCDSRTSA